MLIVFHDMVADINALTIRLNATQYFIIKIPNSRELQQIALNNLSEIEFKVVENGTTWDRFEPRTEN